MGLPQNGQLCTYTNMSAGLMKMATRSNFQLKGNNAKQGVINGAQ
ncbi:hypothetical protein VCHC46B1_2521 [Vibrio cholerae HC-46B1]|nr:hypothetical protein VCHE48_2790 [Vibrio cholerae HE48]EJH50911.1 hypothetical protein VCHC43B1_2484 [Vibrio cholerae HC-43B1]EJH64017.1 hypothetical protein VCHE45_1626 [Vibrio cholerae HE-45]EKK92796.1 hypothetical protein VCCP1035_2017 [Vibrio cholerae CP1035(8)]EKL02772.1 hypothetical protein VCHC41B1_2066 [Vibrio cholerae HC-41B1]EKL95586.1 hypothetical protein VCHC46B1_2521 [Vibrio cholerae HC-46B1]EKM03459.1 hypothetical protein VCHC44C1_2120 [Vibrio cholerae HC-44C1]EMP85877.1 hyp